MHSVLVVDDETGIRTILTRWLTTAGYDVREAEDADAALVAMKASPADVVMCDITMPGHDGLWLAAELHKLYPASAVILATGHDSVPPASSMQAGLVEYIVKPFEPKAVRRSAANAARWHDGAVTRGPQTPAAADALDKWFAGS